MEWLIVASLTLAPAWDSAAPPRVMSLEANVLANLNAARSRPQDLLRALEVYKASFRGDVALGPGGGADVTTREGEGAVEEAIRFVGSATPRAPLIWDADLARIAADHADDQARTGLVGHQSSTGESFKSRIGAANHGHRVVSELISYGQATEEGVVRQLIVDDGEPDRAHRAWLYSPMMQRVGVACRPHPSYRYSCVIDLADGDNAEPRALGPPV